MRLTALLILVIWLNSVPCAAADESAADLFAGKCARCHTFGHGRKKGPDLKKVADWDLDRIHRQVVKMQRKAGHLSEQEIAGLTTYVKEEAQKCAQEAPPK
ncbi:MAG TPA: cytochrome c [Candidatus Obscuribacterales bacterium]